MDIKKIDLLKLQTKAMQEDIDVKGFSAALTKQFQKLAEEAIQVSLYPRTGELPESVLDVLAWQFEVDWYDSNSDLQTKRKAIDEALLIHQIRGTPAAVQKVVEVYLGDGEVEEWFDYNGQPYHFRVKTNNPEATNEKAALLATSIDKVKRKSTVLDSVIIVTGDSMNLYEGFALHIGDNIIAKQVV